MKKAKNVKIGSVVTIPEHCFAPNRSGWNGWDFTVGIVRRIGVDKVDKKKKFYEVEYPSRNYNYKSCKTTITKWFGEKAVFDAEVKIWCAKTDLEYKREDYFEDSYSAVAEFLIDEGIIKEGEK